MAQTVRAVLLAMATRTTLVGRLANNSPIQGEGLLGAATRDGRQALARLLGAMPRARKEG